MKKNLEQNYISMILVINDEKKDIIDKIEKIDEILNKNFKNSEIIIVDNTVGKLNLNNLPNSKIKYTLIKLPIKHGNQQALNAGTAMSIGDYIVEIEDISFDVDYNKIMDLYKKSQEGYDFVFLTPKKSKRTSEVFYKILNSYFKNIFNSDISSSIMSLSTRRGQNKISEVGKRVINRNVAYVLSGLKTFSIITDVEYKNRRKFSDNLMLMLDTLIYHTDYIMIISQKLSFIFLGFFSLGIIYSLILKLFFNIVEGWASLFIILSLGFFGIFFILSIVIRYLHHILRSSLNIKDYIFESVDKK